MSTTALLPFRRHTAAPTRRDVTPPPALRIVQATMLGPLGALVVFGSAYFSVIAPPQSLAAQDWVVAIWALAMGLAALGIGARLGRADERLRRAAVALAGLHVVFSLVKLVGYDETEAATFMAFDALVIVLLTLRRTRRHPS